METYLYNDILRVGLYYTSPLPLSFSGRKLQLFHGDDTAKLRHSHRQNVLSYVFVTKMPACSLSKTECRRSPIRSALARVWGKGIVEDLAFEAGRYS